MTFRKLSALASLACLILLGAAYFIEYGLAKAPCPLCLLQRYMLWAVMLCFLLGAIHQTKARVQYVYCSLVIFFASLGLGLSVRQVYLQHLPKEALPNCTAGLDRLLEFQPLHEVLKVILTSSGECGNVDFEVLGLSLAVWSTIMFLGLLGFAFMVILWIKKRRG